MTITLGYTIFYVDDVGATLRYFTEAFGLTQTFVTPENDYGELDTGPTTLSFASIELAAKNLDAAGGFAPMDPGAPPPAASITLLTSDVASTLEAAVRAGGQTYVEPIEKPWGQTVAYVRDPNGILVEIATPVAS